MGVLKTVLQRAVTKQINKHFKYDSAKSKRTTSRDIQEKQKLAEDIRLHAKLQSQQLLKIVNDCAELVNTTVNPDVFFMRYNLMLEKLEELAGLECTGIFDNSPELPSEAFLRVEAQFTAATNEFLERSLKKAKEHADTLKTESGKSKAMSRYFDNMEKYSIHMDSESLEYLYKMKETYLKGNNEK